MTNYTICIHATVSGDNYDDAQEAATAMEMQGERFGCKNIMIEVMEQPAERGGIAEGTPFGV